MNRWRVYGFLLLGFMFSINARAEIYALIMTISDYQAGIPKLGGVVHDGESARQMARVMGVKDENIQQYRDAQLDLAGMGHAFDDLEARVAAGDRVFIYYSGHGSRQQVHDPETRCAESLVTVDGYGFIDAELENRLTRLSSKVQKVIVMIDSCHSGGVTVRGLQGGLYTPKYWSKGGEDSCETPVNVLTRDIRTATRSVGSGGSNYVYIAAANDNEVSLDDSRRGGIATQAWMACLAGEAVDQDGSGGLSADEIQSCAQKKIDVEMKGVTDYLPQHINLIGNTRMVLSLASKAPEGGSAQPAQQPVAAAQDETGAMATLTDIYQGRDDRRVVEFIPNQSRLTIGVNKLEFSVRSSNPGYLYLLMVGSDGQTFDVLFPNRLDQDNHLQAGQKMAFPRSNWEVMPQGPAGVDRILAIVSDAPRDLSKLPLTHAGPFSVVEATTSGQRGIHLITSTPTPEIQAECSNTLKRTLAVAQVCSEAYGAALITLEEVK